MHHRKSLSGMTQNDPIIHNNYGKGFIKRGEISQHTIAVRYNSRNHTVCSVGPRDGANNCANNNFCIYIRRESTLHFDITLSGVCVRYGTATKSCYTRHLLIKENPCATDFLLCNTLYSDWCSVWYRLVLLVPSKNPGKWDTLSISLN